MEGRFDAGYTGRRPSIKNPGAGYRGSLGKIQLTKNNVDNLKHRKGQMTNLLKYMTDL
jgi:hypothetical protein